jgi:hypothetical protein
MKSTHGRKDMAATKKENVLDFFNTGYDEYDVDYRENSITESYDFVIDTGTSRIFLKIGQKRWDDSNRFSIIDFLKSKEEQIRKAVSDNRDAILRMN